ncbi:YesL family protein [Gracilibacillus caseinilyticus]|uniref:YesL family protein n=1 Tax=Gracilibacillus caseinilyticus TaxID=2932256 RepID=A0ABY4F047_9BACI|nr:YesL family protein [Gracilibacillus caseinilyticus]UOQ50033.1 YesL family protein [Gracilibacillus caseinilyticus]
MMEMSGLWGGFYRISVWITRFAWLNILWICFTLLGLVFFGIMPATIAMFTIVRKWVLKEFDTAVAETFWHAYKQNFIRANLFGLILYIIGYFLSVFLKYTGLMSDSSVYPLLLGIFIIAAFLYVMLVLYIGPVYVHYQLSFWQYIRYAVSIGAVNLHYSICALTILAGIYYLSLKYPGVTLFFTFSISSYVTMFVVHIGFRQLFKKQQEQLDQTTVSAS